jgi:hypothetical protein
VQVQAERHARRRRRVQRGQRVALDGAGGPDGKRRVVGDEVAADVRLVGDRGGRPLVDDLEHPWIV